MWFLDPASAPSRNKTILHCVNLKIRLVSIRWTYYIHAIKLLYKLVLFVTNLWWKNTMTILSWTKDSSWRWPCIYLHRWIQNRVNCLFIVNSRPQRGECTVTKIAHRPYELRMRMNRGINLTTRFGVYFRDGTLETFPVSSFQYSKLSATFVDRSSRNPD